ncbi:hypothetical protein SBDP1_1090025 [Syntrophobacter sp. SbD1]|nr:hypothetical protein SBDP1_1090025 [Syntrophobacter sp. SbD1]
MSLENTSSPFAGEAPPEAAGTHARTSKDKIRILICSILPAKEIEFQTVDTGLRPIDPNMASPYYMLNEMFPRKKSKERC